MGCARGAPISETSQVKGKAAQLPRCLVRQLANEVEEALPRPVGFQQCRQTLQPDHIDNLLRDPCPCKVMADSSNEWCLPHSPATDGGCLPSFLTDLLLRLGEPPSHVGRTLSRSNGSGVMGASLHHRMRKRGDLDATPHPLAPLENHNGRSGLSRQGIEPVPTNVVSAHIDRSTWRVMQIGLARIHLLATSVLNGSPTLLGATPASNTSRSRTHSSIRFCKPITSNCADCIGTGTRASSRNLVKHISPSSTSATHRSFAATASVFAC